MNGAHLSRDNDPTATASPQRNAAPTRTWAVAAVLGVLVLAGAVAMLSGGDGERLTVDENRGELTPIEEGATPRPPEGATRVEVTSQRHVEGDVEYSTVPGAGGDHAPVWANCGFYATAQSEEQSVHSLEHGAVWVAYQPDLDDASLQQLRSLAAQPYTLVTPVEGLEAPVVATAWGARMPSQSVEDPALVEFLEFFRQGPQTPEPGAPCTGGVGTPQ